MDLIYADVENGLIIDRGVLNNYSFDLSFGEDENNFELRCPIEGTRLTENQLVYISGTEYGGIIDAIEVDTANLIMIYTGRTWHGILESKVIYPPKGTDYIYLQGDANDVLQYLLELMNIIPGDENTLYVSPEHSFMSVADTDSYIDIDMKVTSKSGNYAHGYTFIRDMLYAANAKLKIVDGVLSAVGLIDYSNDDDFIEGTDQFKAKRNYNSLNHLHCMGRGNLANRYTIDLYLDENGGLLPYAKENPIKDSDYYTDIKALSQSTDPEDRANFAIISEHMVTGVKEIAEIYDYPSIQDTLHYVELESEPEDWSTDLTPENALKDKQWGFQKYFQMDDDGGYNAVQKPALQDAYELQEEQPLDWSGSFSNYYVQGSDGYTHVQSVNEYDIQSTMPTGWYNGEYANYYKLQNNNYVKVQKVNGLILTEEQPSNWTTDWGSYYLANGNKVPSVVPDPVYKLQRKGQKPSDWSSNYKSYYTSDGVEMRPVSGVTKTTPHAILTTYRPTDWKDKYIDYWYQEKGTWHRNTQKSAPKWKPNKYYMDKKETKAPKWVKDKYYTKIQDPEHAPAWAAGTYYTSGQKVPEWGSFTVYKKRTIPNWTYNKYYTAYKVQPIPTWIENTYFEEFVNHYEALVEAAKSKIAEYQNKNTLEISLDEKRIYDINDRVGASDEVTGIRAVERIVQKIIKIERGIVSFDYNTGT